MIEFPKLKDRITCIHCQKEIYCPQERGRPSNCPHCGNFVPDVLWFQKDDINMLANEIKIGQLRDKGIALFQTGNYVEALKCYDEAISLNSEKADLWVNKGSCYLGLGRPEEAIEYLDKGLALDPAAAMGWNNKGAALNSLNKYDEAVECFDNAIKYDGELVNARNGKALALIQLGRTEEAKEILIHAAATGSEVAVAILKSIGVTDIPAPVRKAPSAASKGTDDKPKKPSFLKSLFGKK